jgi:predicted MFS family arabinose efflux permease
MSVDGTVWGQIKKSISLILLVVGIAVNVAGFCWAGYYADYVYPSENVCQQPGSTCSAALAPVYDQPQFIIAECLTVTGLVLIVIGVVLWVVRERKLKDSTISKPNSP